MVEGSLIYVAGKSLMTMVLKGKQIYSVETVSIGSRD